MNAIIGITSYYCVNLKMVTLHDAIKTIQNMFLCFFSKKRTKTCLFSKKIIKMDEKKTKKRINYFSSKPVLFSTLITFQSFFVIFP